MTPVSTQELVSTHQRAQTRSEDAGFSLAEIHDALRYLQEDEPHPRESGGEWPKQF